MHFYGLTGWDIHNITDHQFKKLISLPCAQALLETAPQDEYNRKLEHSPQRAPP